MLQNPGFENGTTRDTLWWTPDGGPYNTEFGEIASPEGWTTWWLEGFPEPGDPNSGRVTGRPEVSVVTLPEFPDPQRIRSGSRAVKWFTFWRAHHGGILQQVAVELGARYQFSVFAHAWYSRCSTKPHERPYDGDCETPIDWPHCYLSVGIDPTGELDPRGVSVVWGAETEVYGLYSNEPLHVEAVAESDIVTVFVRSRTTHAMKHNDVYIDDASFRVIEQLWGLPREQYKRVCVLLPPDAGAEWAQAVVNGSWDNHRHTLTGSADDSGVGQLEDKTVIAVNPSHWPDNLRAFFQQHYPRTAYTSLKAATPDALRALLEGAPPPPPTTDWGNTRRHLTLHLQQGVAGAENFTRNLRPRWIKTFNIGDVTWIKAASWDTRIVYRRHVPNDAYYVYHSDKHVAAREFIALFLPDITWATGLTLNGQPLFTPARTLYVGTVNEVAGGFDPAAYSSMAAFDVAFSEELAATGLPVAPILGAIPIGNPPGTDEQMVAFTELLLPAAEAACQYGGGFDYHAYFGANPDQTYLIDPYWRYYAGRWTWMDEIFGQHGYEPLWFLGEGGACGFDGHGFASGDGWKADNCMCGDWGRYLAALMQMDELTQNWNAQHGDRCAGTAIFTSGGGELWQHFELSQPEMVNLAANLATRYP